MRFVLLAAIVLVPSLACAQPAQQQAPTLQQIIAQQEALQLGALLKQNISLTAQLEAANDALAKANARLKELEPKAPAVPKEP